MALLCQTVTHPVHQICCHLISHNKVMLKLSHLSRRYCSRIKHNNDYLQIHPSVASALANSQPVAALESTIITHGMPYPHNLRTAQEVEKIVRDNGVTPATIGLLNGKIHVGLSEEEIVAMATAKNAVKASRRDISWVLSKKLTGGTTVSATMLVAHKADIPMFVTGGIGGVHRDGENSLDMSADLTELGRTPVAVISAGVKSILDIPRTLEFLETHGVTVATYGPNKDFPAFFTPNSGTQSPLNVTNAREAAELINCSLSLGLQSGILIAVPIPQSFAADGELIEGAIQQALNEAKNNGITGKQVTPFILGRVNELTQGKSLEANVALIKNNANIGSQIAKELSRLRNKGQKLNQNNNCNNKTSQNIKGHDLVGRPVVIGASIVDLLAKVNQDDIVHSGRTYAGSLQVAYGGVGRNIADCLSRLGSRPLFISAVGNDEHAQALRRYCNHMDQSGISTLSDCNTGTYCAVLNNSGDVVFGIGDMDINTQITPQMVSLWERSIVHSPLVCMDGNIPTETIEYVCRICKENHVPLWYEPTCQQKARKPFQSDAWKALTYVSPNINELRWMYGTLEGEETVNLDEDASLTDQIRECLQLSQRLLKHIRCLVITLGENGALICRNAEPEDRFIYGKTTEEEEDDLVGLPSAVHYHIGDVDPERKIISVSGAGDCFSAAMIHCILQGYDSDTCIKAGMMVAQMTLQNSQPVPGIVTTSSITPEMVQTWAPWQPSRMM